MYKCLRCGYEWKGRLDEQPKVCPKCKSYFWDIKKKRKKSNEDMER